MRRCAASLAAAALVASGLAAPAAEAQQGENAYNTLLRSGYVTVHTSFENGSFYLVMHPPAGSPTRLPYLCVIESRHADPTTGGGDEAPEIAPVSLCKEF